MSTLTKWALQATALLLLAALASIAAQWSSQVVNGTSSERLAQLQNNPLSESVALATSKTVVAHEAQ